MGMGYCMTKIKTLFIGASLIMIFMKVGVAHLNMKDNLKEVSATAGEYSKTHRIGSATKATSMKIYSMV